MASSSVQSRVESITSSTSCMSLTGSTNWDENDSNESSMGTMFIGDIDEAFLPNKLVFQEKVKTTVKEDDSCATSDDDTITYDDVMEEIRKDMWEQVRKSKKKRRTKKKPKARITTSSRGQNQLPKNVEDQLVLDAVKDNLNSENSPVLKQRLSSDPDFPKDESDANVAAVQETINLLKTVQRSRGAKNVSTKSKVTKKDIGFSPVDGSMQNEDVWDIQDDFGGMVIDEEGVQRGFQELEMTEKMNKLQELEEDSIFQSILDIDLENDECRKIMSYTTEAVSPAPTAPSLESDVVLKAVVFGSREETMLYIPVTLIEKREIEMRQLAFEKGIRSEQWTRSLLYRKVRCSTMNPEEGMLTIELHPETDCAKAKHSKRFVWHSWLNECVESFYKNGVMQIPDCCVGADILVALQFFGILFSPEQLKYDSFDTYLRLKRWSEYFTHRGTLASWLVSELDETVSQDQIFSTSPFSKEKVVNIWVDNQKLPVLDGGIALSKKLYGRTTSSTLVYSFFNEDEELGDDEWKLDALMREDFCDFIGGILPGIVTYFPVKSAIISHLNGSCENMNLAILHIYSKHALKMLKERPALKDDEVLSHGSFESNFSAPSDGACSPGPIQSKLAACSMLDATAHKSCISQKPRVNDLSQADSEDLSSIGPKLWKPAYWPETLQPASTGDEEDSGIIDGWMSTNKNLEEASTLHEMIQEEAPPTTSLTSQGKMNVDHIYADLLLQDTEFFYGWEEQVASADWHPDNKELKSPLRLVNGRDAGKLTGTKHDKQQQLITTNQFMLEREAIRYKPKEFVCDVVELFEFTHEGASKVREGNLVDDKGADVATLIRQHEAKKQLQMQNTTQKWKDTSEKSSVGMPTEVELEEKKSTASIEAPFAEFNGQLAQLLPHLEPTQPRVSLESSLSPPPSQQQKAVTKQEKEEQSSAKNKSRHIQIVPKRLGELVKRKWRKPQVVGGVSKGAQEQQTPQPPNNNLIPGIDFPDDEGIM